MSELNNANFFSPKQQKKVDNFLFCQRLMVGTKYRLHGRKNSYFHILVTDVENRDSILQKFSFPSEPEEIQPFLHIMPFAD